MSTKKWLNKRYEVLWQQLNNNGFTAEQASKILRENTKDKPNAVNTILSELRKDGLLSAAFDPKDARKRIYTLKGKDEIITETLVINNQTITRGGLENLFKKAADLIRTRVDYSFILVLLFYKRISDKWESEYQKAYQEALANGFTEKEAQKEAANESYHDFNLPQPYLWENIRKDPARLPENFSKAMKALADKNPELKEVFENMDFAQFTNNRENAELLRQLVELFSAQSLHQVKSDIMGDAYEWILKFFAPQKAKEGEIYTPREVIHLLVRLMDPKPGNSVYDPTLGSAGMLILAYQHLKELHGDKQADKLFLYGQEANYKTLALSKMNLYIHDIRNAQIMPGDTLLYPKFKEGSSIKKFDIVIANPPWNQDGYDEDVLKKGEFYRDRFNYGPTNKQSADWVWIQHMLASAKEKNGKIGIIIDNGCLFRGGKERALRMAVLKDDLFESVILLPEKLFYNTGAPGAIVTFNKNKPKDRANKVLFINASQEFIQHPEVRKLNALSEANQKKIVDAFMNFQEIEGFSRVVDISEIAEKNDYNLNVTLYVYPEEIIEHIDIKKEWAGLQKTESESREHEKKLEKYLKELGYI